MQSLESGLSTADPRLFLPYPRETSMYADGEIFRTSQRYRRCGYMDLGDLPEVKRVFESEVSKYRYGVLRMHDERRLQDLMDRSRLYKAGEYHNIPVWVEWSGHRAVRDFEGLRPHEIREVAYELHHPDDVYGTGPDNCDSPFCFYQWVNQVTLTYDMLRQLARSYLYDPMQLVPRTYFTGLPMELVDELWRYLDRMARGYDHTVHNYQSGGWWFGAQRLIGPPHVAHPPVLLHAQARYSGPHTEWSTTEELLKRYHGNSDRVCQRAMKRAKIVRLDGQECPRDDLTMRELYDLKH